MKKYIVPKTSETDIQTGVLCGSGPANPGRYPTTTDPDFH